jgi:hypothetical protein
MFFPLRINSILIPIGLFSPQRFAEKIILPQRHRGTEKDAKNNIDKQNGEEGSLRKATTENTENDI